MSQENNLVPDGGLPTVLKLAFAFVDSMALKCAIELGIPDIINAHGRPISISEISSHFKSPSPDLACLSCVMQLLVRRELFTMVSPSPNQSSETLYGLTPVARLLLKESEDSLSYAPMVLMHHHPKFLAPWHHLSPSIKDGGVAFEKAHGHSIWDLISNDPEFRKVFHDGMACSTKNGFRAIASEYRDVFSGIGSIVDVGGGTGAAAGEIVRVHSDIKAINFDLPHVIAIAPKHPGVTHVEGDMFNSIPNADVVILKSILHDWSDEDCVKILQNCRKAIPEKTGKVLVFEELAQQEEKSPMEDIVAVSDLLMILLTGVGRERTEFEYQTLLENAGFPRYNLISKPGVPSIIEA